MATNPLQSSTNTTFTEQMVREAPEIEAQKYALMRDAANLARNAPYLPGYQVAGMTGAQQQAVNLGQAGIGAYQPYLSAAGTSLGRGAGTLGEAANVLRGADTRGQFYAAQEAMNQAALPASMMGQYAEQAGAGLGYLGQGAQGMQLGQQLAQNAPAQAEPGYGMGMGAMGAGIGTLAGGMQGFSPSQIQDFMNPYQQAVIDEAMSQINRQGDISRQNLQAQAVRSGAFGGAREGVQRAELERGLAATRNAAITNALQSGYQSAAQQAQQAFEQQQQRQLAAGQGMGNIGSQIGNLAGQRGQLALQSAGTIGNLGAQQAGLAGQLANISAQQAGILGQQSQLQQALGQGIGNLAGQQFGIGYQTAQGLGTLGTQMGNIGAQQAGLGAQAQSQQQADVNMLYNLGAQQQKQQQAELDAQRATQMQNAMQPYQNLAFVSDIYRGAPSTQMGITAQAAPTPSPFQQIAGLGIGALGTIGALSGANKSGGIGGIL